MPNPPPLPPPPLSLSTSASVSSSTSSSSAHLQPLTKFPLHTPANASSPLITCSSSTGPLPNQTLLNLRTVLVASRFAASTRVQLKEDNKKLLIERQNVERKTAEEAGRVKEGERRKKREEEERREKERVEKLERERLEVRQREERELAIRRQQEEDLKRVQVKENEDRERERKVHAQKQAAKKENQAKKATAMKGPPPLPPPIKEDTVMKEVQSQKNPIPTDAASSPEPEEDLDQPKPPRHHDKKKRKRDHVIDSDDSGTDTQGPEQPILQKIRKLDSFTQGQSPTPISTSTPTPAPASGSGTAPPTPSALNSPLPQQPHASTSSSHEPSLPRPNPLSRRLKEERFTKHSIPIKPSPAGNATAFYVPQYPLVPLKPPCVPPVPTAKRQAEVRGDFSNAKPGQQIAHSTFTNWTEMFLRPFGEDDLAFLANKPEDVTPYIIPPLGKPYLQKWEEEDFDHPPQNRSRPLSHQQQQQHPLEPPPLPRLKPAHLSEEAMGTENIFLGPLSERLMSALAFEEASKWIERDEEESEEEGDGIEEEPEGLGEGERQRNARKAEMDAVDLEERIKRELRFIGLLPEEEVDWTTREDDEISTSLRACQRLLQQQVELNESRKSILMSIVKDRMAYQDYETARDAQERVIEAGWHKRQRTDHKKKKKVTAGGAQVKEKKEEDPSKVPISPVLMEAVEKRNALVECFKPWFEEGGDTSRWWGIPEKSVYEGMLESIEEEEDEEG